MNDPGLDQPISEDAKDIEDQKIDEKEQRDEEEEAFLEPSRWWFASTAFPLMAGTFGPMASAFSICALAVHWRVYIPPGAAEENGVPIDDPKWWASFIPTFYKIADLFPRLIAINAAQLAIALISNLFLLLNMARRVRFSIAQPITIIGW
jgi:potassium channel subfamily K